MPEDKIREGGREGEALRAALKGDAAVAAAEVVFFAATNQNWTT